MSAPTEEEILDAINHVAHILAARFALGRADLDDAAAEARLACVEALPKFVPGKAPLRNYLYVAARNSLMNRIRKLVRREDGATACARCHAAFWGDSASGEPCTEGGCGKWRAWAERQRVKAAIFFAKPMHSSTFTSGGKDFTPDGHGSEAAHKRAEMEGEAADLEEHLSVRLPASVRPFYLRMKDGAEVTRHQRRAVQDAVIRVLVELED